MVNIPDKQCNRRRGPATSGFRVIWPTIQISAACCFADISRASAERTASAVIPCVPPMSVFESARLNSPTSFTDANRAVGPVCGWLKTLVP